jgi:hypothetical protein
MSVKQALLERVRQRAEPLGIGLASGALRGLGPCLHDQACAERFFGMGSLGQWKDALNQADHRLVYHHPDMRVEGGLTSANLVAPTPDQVRAFGQKADDLTGVPASAIMSFDCVYTSTRQDRDGDVLESKGANLDPYAPLLWQHLPVQPIGKVIRQLLQTSRQATCRCAIADTELGRDAARLVEFGALRISHGFRPLEFEPLETRKDAKEQELQGPNGFHVTRFDVLEVSLVSVPSNTDAVITVFARAKLYHPLVRAWAEELWAAVPSSVRSGWEARGCTVEKCFTPGSGQVACACGKTSGVCSCQDITPIRKMLGDNTGSGGVEITPAAGLERKPMAIDEDRVAQVAQGLSKHPEKSPDYGSAFVHQAKGLVHYTLADGDSLGVQQEAEKQFGAIPGVKGVVFGDEFNPSRGDGWRMCHPQKKDWKGLYLPVEVLEKMCPTCGAQVRAKGWKAVSVHALESVGFKATPNNMQYLCGRLQDQEHPHSTCVAMVQSWGKDAPDDPHAFCFAPGNLVHTRDRGLVAIEALAAGDMVKTDRGGWKPVGGAICTNPNYSGELVEIQTQLSSVPLRLTPDHRVIAMQGADFKPGTRYRGGRGHTTVAERLEIRAADLRECDYLLFPAHYQVIDRPDVSDDWLRILGWYAGDGHLNTTRWRHEVWLTLGRRDVAIAEEFACICERQFNKRVRVIDRGKYGQECIQIGVSCEPLRAFLEEACGRGCDKKRFAAWVMALPAHRQKLVLDAYWQTDGHFRPVRNEAVASTVSFDMAVQVRDMLLATGHLPSLRLAKRGGVELIQGRQVKTLDSWVVAYRPGLKYSTRAVVRNDDYIALQVTSLRRVAYDGPVYDVQVADDNTLCGPYWSAHNCGWLQSQCGSKPPPKGDTAMATPETPETILELKFNPNHDEHGRFASADASSKRAAYATRDAREASARAEATGKAGDHDKAADKHEAAESANRQAAAHHTALANYHKAQGHEKLAKQHADKAAYHRKVATAHHQATAGEAAAHTLFVKARMVKPDLDCLKSAMVHLDAAAAHDQCPKVARTLLGKAYSCVEAVHGRHTVPSMTDKDEDMGSGNMSESHYQGLNKEAKDVGRGLYVNSDDLSYMKDAMVHCKDAMAVSDMPTSVNTLAKAGQEYVKSVHDRHVQKPERDDDDDDGGDDDDDDDKANRRVGQVIVAYLQGKRVDPALTVQLHSLLGEQLDSGAVAALMTE